jgi:hypothetical protein
LKDRAIPGQDAEEPQNKPPSALSESERAALFERVSLEISLRQEIEESRKTIDRGERSPRKLPAWLESNLMLLLIGSLISTILVPYLQNKQESVKWRRQNEYDNLKYRLNQMRASFEQFLNVSAYTSDVNEASKLVLANAKLKPEEYTEFQKVFRDLQEKRSHEISKVASLFIYFPNPNRAQEAYNLYLETAAEFNAKVERIAAATFALSQKRGSSVEWKGLEDAANGLASEFPKLNELYDSVSNELRNQIREVERESEQIH